jgi:hypothetical protein
MHLNHLVVAVKKLNGDTLRESDILSTGSTSPIATHASKSAKVYLPFGTEYSLFLKNTADTRAVLDITIDGTNVLGGDSMVVEPRSESRLERFLLDGNLNSGRRFKFVALTDPGVQNPSEPRNGLVEVICRWEAPPTPIQIRQIPTPVFIWPEYFPVYRPTYPYRRWPTHDPWYSDDVPPSPLPIWSTTSASYSVGNANNVGAVGASSNRPIQCNAFHADLHADVPSAAAAVQHGATVEGSASNQQFSNVRTGTLLEDTTILRFQILAPATTDAPVTVKETRRKDCAKCGARIPAYARFCLVCGAECTTLEGGSSMCTACGAEFKAVDNFCASCGTRVVNQK